MFVKEIKNYDDFSNEADIIVTDGTYEVLCYCHPAEFYEKGSTVQEILSLFAKDIMRISDKMYEVKKLEDDYYAYHLQGEVIKIDKPIIRIGGLEIVLDSPLAKDIKLGEFIEFDVYRLNCEI